MKAKLQLILSFILFYGLISCQTHNKDDLWKRTESYGHPSQKMYSSYLKKSKIFQSYPCKRGQVVFYENGKLFRFCLAEPMIIQSYPCKEEVILDTLGKLGRFMLAKDHIIASHLIPAESEIVIDFEKRKKHIYISRDTEIQGYLVRTKIGLFGGIPVTIGNDGSLFLFYMVNETDIDGIPCSNGLISLFPDGKLLTCNLSKDFEIDDRLFLKGTHMIFEENGKAHEFSQSLNSAILRRLNLF